MKKKIINNLIIIALLVGIDILIKIIIDNFFMNQLVMLFDGFGFKPHLNTTQLSIFNNELDLNISTGVLIVLNIVLLPVIPLTVYWVHKKDSLFKGVNIVVDFIMAGAVCSLVDKIIWGGSLDYIYLMNRWIIDLKDIYLFGGIVLYFVCAIGYEIRKYRLKDR